MGLAEDGCQVNGHILARQAVVFSQQLLVLLMGAELDGSIGDDSNHGSRVSPPQTEEAILQVGSVDQFVRLLRSDAHANKKLYIKNVDLENASRQFPADKVEDCVWSRLPLQRILRKIL